MRRMSRPESFAARGGWWVVGQVPVLIAAAVLPPWTAAVSGFGHWLQVAGAVLLAAGFALVAGGLLALGSALTPFPRPRRGATLVTRGVYAYLRHPIYSGLLAAALGWAAAWLSAPGALYVLVVAVFFDRKAAREETWLRERFPGYAAYAKRVKRFVPGVY